MAETTEQSVAGRRRRSAPGRNPVATFHGLGADRTGLVRRQFQFSPARAFGAVAAAELRRRQRSGRRGVVESKADEKCRRRSPRHSKGRLLAVSIQSSLTGFDCRPHAATASPQPLATRNTTTRQIFEHRGGGTADREQKVGSGGDGAMTFGHGPKVDGDLGIGRGTWHGHEPRQRRLRHRLGGIGRGSRTGDGHTGPSRTAVNAALVWLANHQDYDGHWSLQHFTQRVQATRPAPAQANFRPMPARRRWACCPSLPPGRRTSPKARTRSMSAKASQWLIAHQQPDGNLAKGAEQMMYSHGLATIALCEAYGLTGDRQVGVAAQGAVNFILSAQNTADGGWRYNPKDPGDTSVVGWQLMALKRPHMAGLNVGGSVFSGTSKWLDSVAVHDGAEYAYQPEPGSFAHDDLGRPALPPVPGRKARQPHAHRRHGLSDESHARRRICPTSTIGITRRRSCTT